MKEHIEDGLIIQVNPHCNFKIVKEIEASQEPVIYDIKTLEAISKTTFTVKGLDYALNISKGIILQNSSVHIILGLINNCSEYWTIGIQDRLNK